MPDLWNRLADPAAALGAATLPPTMRRAVWKMLTERKDDVIAVVGAVPLGTDPHPIPWDSPEIETYIAAEAANIHLIASPAMQDACLGVYAARLNRFQLSLPQRQTLRILGEAKGRGALQSVLTTTLGIENRNYSYVIKNLEERGLVTKCPTVLQRGSGHVTSTNLIVLTKFAPEEMTDPQARFHDGKSSTFTQDVGNNHASGSRRIYNNRGGGGDGIDDDGNGGDIGGGSSGEDNDDDDDDNIGFDDLGGVEVPSTGGIPGSRALSSVQGLNTYGTIDSSHKAPRSMNEAGGGLHVVLDDDGYLRKITTLLASLPDHSSNETDLKKELGYIGRRGHRRWRRLRNILERKKCIKRYKARESHNEGSVVFIVKLLKAYTAEVDEEWLLNSLLDPLTGNLNVFGEQVAELTLDRQLLTMLAVAGPDGITTQHVDSQLRFNIKRNEPRFKELKMRYGEGSVVEQYINQGKVRLLRYNATPEFLAILDSALQGVSADAGGRRALEPPPGGYVNAVREAIHAGLNEDGSNPLAKYTSPVADGDGEACVAEEEVDLVAQLLATVGNNNDNNAAAAPVPVSDAAPEGDADEEENEEADDEDDTGDGYGAGPSNHDAEKKTGAAAVEVYAPRTKRKKQPLTEMAKLRRQWIIDRVHREGLLLCAEIGSYLQVTEKAVRNNPKAVRPDRKVVQRLIDAALEANELILLRVTFPGVYGSLTARTHEVLAKPNTQADSDFVDLVFAAHRQMLARIRQSSSAVLVSKHEDAALETLPIVANAKRRKEKEEREAKRKAMSVKSKNGKNDGAEGIDKRGEDENGGDGGGGGAATTAANGDSDTDKKQNAVPGPLDHGLICARMQRVWKIHELAWKLLEARNGTPSPFLNSSLSAAAAEEKVFLVGHAPASLLGGRPLDMGVYKGTPEQQAVVVTTDEFWKALTVEDFVMCLGSRSTDAGLVQEYKVANKRMGK